MEWQTTKPPMDRDIEVETTGRQTRKGTLAFAGSWQMSSSRQINAAEPQDQFMIKGGQPEMFEVHRWREIEAN